MYSKWSRQRQPRILYTCCNFHVCAGWSVCNEKNKTYFGMFSLLTQTKPRTKHIHKHIRFTNNSYAIQSTHTNTKWTNIIWKEGPVVAYHMTIVYIEKEKSLGQIIELFMLCHLPFRNRNSAFEKERGNKYWTKQIKALNNKKKMYYNNDQKYTENISIIAFVPPQTQRKKNGDNPKYWFSQHFTAHNLNAAQLLKLFQIMALNWCVVDI